MQYAPELARKGMEILDQAGLTPVHELILGLVGGEGLSRKVLEIGCGAGHLSEALQARGHSVTGVEMVATFAEAARGRMDRFIQGDFQQETVRDQIPTDHNIVILADVIEHFDDPWATIETLRTFALPGAAWLLTFPNVAHWSIRRQLLCGDWEYTDFGILDRTHLRFFSLPSARRFLSVTGLRDEGFFLTQISYPFRSSLLRLPGWTLVDGLLQRFCPNLVAAHFLFKCR